MLLKHKWIIILGLMMGWSPRLLLGQPVRQDLNINRDWKFLLGDKPGAEAFSFDEAGWSNINIPHNFSEPYFQEARWYVGYGWYRKHITVPAAWKNKSIFIEFEGAFREAEIFVNGQKIGEHNSGYTGFSFDIGHALKTGDNVLAVRLSNRWNASLAPRSGDHNFTGGIYRDVHLVVTSPEHVTWYGTFVTTPKVSKKSGQVVVKTEVENSSAWPKTCILKTSVIDPSGYIVDVFSSSLKIPSKGTVTYNQTGHAISNPKLWHPDHPYLYKLKSVLYNGKKILDESETDFGFRWMEWTADKGFFLNGGHYYFRGANVHQDHAGWASAVTNSGIFRDVKLVKDAGMDFIRGSHYPHDPSFAAACDYLGVLFLCENNFWGSGGYEGEGSWFTRAGAYPVKEADRQSFETSVKNSLRDMIRINRNHPSIITWSMCNEPFFTEQGTLPRVHEFLKELTALAHELDPSRKVTVGGVQRGDLDKTGDIAGYNGDGARLFINPGVPSIVSEYGSTVTDRPGKYDPGFGDLAKQPQFDWRSGQAIWCAFDYGTTFGELGHMGIVDYQRIPKRAWYWYRNEYKKIAPPEWPVEGVAAALQLTADKNTIAPADGTDDIQLLVTVIDAKSKPISNSPDVTLTLVSGPGEFPTGSAITFSHNSDIPIRDGKAAIEFRSYYTGRSIIKASSPGLKDAYITIVSKNAPAFVPGKTVVVTERPYQRFAKNPPEEGAKLKGDAAFNKPTQASSEADSHAGLFANDRDAKTYWSARSGQKGEWLRIDLENSFSIAKVKLRFPIEKNGTYSLQISADGNIWTVLNGEKKLNIEEKSSEYIISTMTKGRFLRVLFSDMPEGQKAAISEIEIYPQ